MTKNQFMQVSLGMKPSFFADESGEESEDAPEVLESAGAKIGSSDEQDEDEVRALKRLES